MSEFITLKDNTKLALSPFVKERNPHTYLENPIVVACTKPTQIKFETPYEYIKYLLNSLLRGYDREMFTYIFPRNFLLYGTPTSRSQRRLYLTSEDVKNQENVTLRDMKSYRLSRPATHAVGLDLDSNLEVLKAQAISHQDLKTLESIERKDPTTLIKLTGILYKGIPMAVVKTDHLIYVHVYDDTVFTAV
jgi:hypothetical protein